MKKYLIVLVLLLSLSFQDSKAQAFTAKNFNIDIGANFGYSSYYGFNTGVLVSAEKGIHKWIGVGAYTGFKYHTYNSDISVPFGVTGSFHFYQMISDLVGKEMGSDKFDLAIKHSLGLRLYLYNGSNIVINGGTSLQARYFFTDAFGIYAEVGYPVQGAAIAGLALKF